ncbi:MAG TPA: hypothetical protein PLT05_02885, partial [bacterium]|nr:hypothetical protein [bacterium]
SGFIRPFFWKIEIRKLKIAVLKKNRTDTGARICERRWTKHRPAREQYVESSNEKNAVLDIRRFKIGKIKVKRY